MSAEAHETTSAMTVQPTIETIDDLWAGFEPRREGKSIVGTTPFMSYDDTIYVFAKVTYRSGVKLSSRLLQIPVRDLPGATPTGAEPRTGARRRFRASSKWLPSFASRPMTG